MEVASHQQVITRFSVERGMRIMSGFFIHKRIISAIKKVDFGSDRMSYENIIIRGHWCDVIVLNVHAPTEEKD
jgi:hypothetical protein